MNWALIKDDFAAKASHIELREPSAFWALIILAPLILAWLFMQPSKIVAVILRSLCVTLLLLALSDPVLREERKNNELTVLLDVSKSVTKKAVARFSENLRPFILASNSLTVYPFARNVSDRPITLNSSADLDRLVADLEDLRDSADSGASDIEHALQEVSHRSFGAPVLLLTDGRENSGSAERCVAQGLLSGMNIYPLVIDESSFQNEDLSISAIYAPLTVEAGNKAPVRVSLKNRGSQKTTAHLSVSLGSAELLSREVEVEPKQELLINLETPPLEGGLHELKATLVGKVANRTKEENTSLEHRWLAAKKKDKILLIGGSQEDSSVLYKAVRSQGFAVEHIIADGNKDMPTSLSGYTGVVISNTPRRQLSDGFLPLLKGFVEQGGGLILVGGDRSYGLGGYLNTALEEISPLKFVPPTTTKKRLNSAVVLLIDKSRSMTYQDKILSAKKAVLSSIETLKDEDYVSVIGFDSSPFIIIDLLPVPEAREMAERRLKRLTASGGTNLLPALDMARKSLSTTDASRKHVIVLSDGKLADAGRQYVEAMSRMREADITLSSIAMGEEADVPFMQMLSEYGKGAFYRTLDPSTLPQIFLQDIKVSTGEKTIKEKADFPVAAGPAGLVSAKDGRWPNLTGFVETLPKRGSRLELITKREGQAYPIMASWEYQKGQVVAFTSDANGRWSAPWLRWEGFAPFWSQLVDTVRDTTASKEANIDFDIRYSISGTSVDFSLAIFDEKLAREPAPAINAKITQPGGALSVVNFTEIQKGLFHARLDKPRPGDHKLEIHYGQVTLAPVAITIKAESFGEKTGEGLNYQLLSDLAYYSGGFVNPEPKDLLGKQAAEDSITQLYPWPLLAAFVILLIEAFVRERGVFFAFAILLRKRFKARSLSSENEGERGARARVQGSYSKGGRRV